MLVDDLPAVVEFAEATGRTYPHADFGAVEHGASDADQEVAEGEPGVRGDLQVADLVADAGAVRGEPLLRSSGRLGATTDERGDGIDLRAVVGASVGGLGAADAEVEGVGGVVGGEPLRLVSRSAQAANTCAGVRRSRSAPA